MRYILFCLLNLVMDHVCRDCVKPCFIKINSMFLLRNDTFRNWFKMGSSRRPGKGPGIISLSSISSLFFARLRSICAVILLSDRKDKPPYRELRWTNPFSPSHPVRRDISLFRRDAYGKKETRFFYAL